MLLPQRGSSHWPAAVSLENYIYILYLRFKIYSTTAPALGRAVNAAARLRAAVIGQRPSLRDY